jgi:hypothetical protein
MPDGVISMRPSKRAEMLPEVPWLIPAAFISRQRAMISALRARSAFFMLPPIAWPGATPDYTGVALRL